MNTLIYVLAVFGAFQLLVDIVFFGWLWWFWKHGETAPVEDEGWEDDAIQRAAPARSRKKEKRPMAG